MTLASPTRFGPYEIAEHIGAAGMGEVYRAHDAELGRDVAIKVLPESFSTDWACVARFEQEAKTLAALNHSNIAQIYGLAKALDTRKTSSGDAPVLTTPAMTEAGIVLGTAAYTSPEQARGKAVDQRADIWAFGCVLYEMITGQLAFGGEDVTIVLARVLERRRISPREVIARCSKGAVTLATARRGTWYTASQVRCTPYRSTSIASRCAARPCPCLHRSSRR